MQPRVQGHKHVITYPDILPEFEFIPNAHFPYQSFFKLVRMYDFKLEGGGGEWFKKDFRKLLSLEWNYFEKTWIRIQFAKNRKQISTTPEKQLVVSQKQLVVYTSSQI